MFVKRIHIINASEDVKKRFVRTSGTIMLNLMEGKCLYEMEKELKMPAWQIDHNIDEMLYDLKKCVGWKRYIKALFKK